MPHCMDEDRLSEDRAPDAAVANRATPILVVEDFSSMVRILRTLLSRIGLDNVDSAIDGRAAIERMRYKKYELVITDCNMPGMSGYKLLREIRTDPRWEMTPVLLMSADPNVVRFIRETDLTQYLVKPFDAEQLSAKIQGLFSLRSTQ